MNFYFKSWNLNHISTVQSAAFLEEELFSTRSAFRAREVQLEELAEEAAQQAAAAKQALAVRPGGGGGMVKWQLEAAVWWALGVWIGVWCA